MKTRITTIIILVAAAITFAQPRMNWNEVGARDGDRFQRPQQQQCYGMQCPQQDFQRQSPNQGFNKRRAAMAHLRMRGMMQQNTPDAFRGQQRFTPQQHGIGGMEGRRFAYPNAEQFKRGQQSRGFGQDFQGRGQMPRPQAPIAFRGKDGFKPQGGQMEGRRFAYPGAQQFKMDGRGGDFDRRKDSGKFEGRKGHNQKFDKPREKGVCPMNKMDAPKQQRAPKEAMEAPKPHKAPADIKSRKDAEGAKDVQVKPEVTELRLKLRSAMIEKDYKTAEKVLKQLAEVDK